MSDPINKPLAIITRTIIGLLVLAVSLGIAYYLTETRPEIQQTPLDASLPQVKVLKVAPVAVHLQWSGYGTVQAMDRSDVPSRVNSIVSTIPAHLQPGVTVKTGEVLAILDSSDFDQQQQIAQQNISQINANLSKLDTEEKFLIEQTKLNADDVELARREWDRTLALFNNKAGTQQDVDRAHQVYLVRQRTLLAGNMQQDQITDTRQELTAKLKAQQETLAKVKIDVDRCTITSPIDGVLASLDVDLGEIVTMGKRIARVVSLKRMEVSLQLPASARSAVAVGDRVTLSPVGDEKLQLEHTISRIAPQDDSATRTFTVYVQFDRGNSDRLDLAPGRYVQGTVHSNKVEKHWLVPSRSVQADQVMIVRDGRVMTLPANITHLIRKQFDDIAINDESWAILGTPLQTGDAIILTPSRLVSDGKQVEQVIMDDQSKLGSGDGQ